MTTITEMIPDDLLSYVLDNHTRGHLLLAAISGAHAYGYANRDSPLELKGIYVEPTEHLLGLTEPPRSTNWVGELEGHRIDYSACELAQALRMLLRGSGSALERIMAPRQIGDEADRGPLRRIARGVLCRRFYSYYRNNCKRVLRDCEENADHVTVRHLLSAFRSALTGVHLLRTGEIELDLRKLADDYELRSIPTLIAQHADQSSAQLERPDRWKHLLVQLRTMLDEALDASVLPIDPDHPRGAEDYLLDMRRRFFDAVTVQR